MFAKKSREPGEAGCSGMIIGILPPAAGEELRKGCEARNT
jgi:hypothetical protein